MRLCGVLVYHNIMMQVAACRVCAMRIYGWLVGAGGVPSSAAAGGGWREAQGVPCLIFEGRGVYPFFLAIWVP